MHPLMHRQLRSVSFSAAAMTDEVQMLLDVVHRTYLAFDRDRARLVEANAALGESLAERDRLLWRQIAVSERMQSERRQSQQLEAVGQLAAGIAHEINTPIQYVGDSVGYLDEAFQGLVALVVAYRKLLNDLPPDARIAAQLRNILELETAADIDYAVEQIPAAIERTRDGARQVASIVRATKEFAHPDSREKVAIDLNQAVTSTLVVARNEYKYVADVDTRLGDLPLVPCLPGEINQVILNLVVNAAHAIADAKKPERGRITLSTRSEGGWVTLAVADTGGGIPSAISTRIFEPFFTTKEVGRGTGQGLAIARNIIVDKHGGSIDFDSEMGLGTTFYVRLPLASEPAEAFDAL
jgi:signal transduction histidine kinase